jgi:hypothetical protein
MAQSPLPQQTRRPRCVGPLALCLAILVLAVGCGKRDGSRGAVHGEVTLDGQLLERGSILFVPIDGAKGTVTGGTIEKGRYQISQSDGAALGWNRVEIRAARRTGKMVPTPLARRDSHEMVEEYAAAIPPRFNSASTLKIEVKLGDNTADFDVASK